MAKLRSFVTLKSMRMHKYLAEQKSVATLLSKATLLSLAEQKFMVELLSKATLVSLAEQKFMTGLKSMGMHKYLAMLKSMVTLLYMVTQKSMIKQKSLAWHQSMVDAFVKGDAIIKTGRDYIVFKNWWSSGRYFTWTRSNNMWNVGCFYGSGKELIKKAYADSKDSGKEYERVVRYVESILAD